jgi:hypothetical protein
MCPFKNNHFPLNLLYMNITIKQNILYNKCKHCYTGRPFLLNNRSSLFHENFILLTNHTYLSTEYPKILNLSSLLPLCTVAMALIMTCSMQHNFWLEFISHFPIFFFNYIMILLFLHQSDISSLSF